MLKLQHKTLARTLAYVGRHAPAEFGLFWDPDGTMPWKEFYWALQEDPQLRFVREANLRELTLLGIELPFVLDGNLLRLTPGSDIPTYPVAGDLPDRLFAAVKPKNLVTIQKFGLRSSNRPCTPVCSDPDMALRIAKRRESEPIRIEIQAKRAQEAGIVFRCAGPELYLVEAISPEFLIFPKIRQDTVDKMMERKEKPAPKPAPPTPGSFFVQPHHMPVTGTEAAPRKSGGKGKGGWKRESRKERNKRNV